MRARTIQNDAEQERRLEFYQNWQRVQTDLTKFSLRGATALFETIVLLGALSFFAIFITQIDAPLWSILEGPLLWGIPLHPSGWIVLLILCATMLVNGGLLHHILSAKTPAEHRFRPGLLLLRFLLGGIPVLGWYVVPLWQQIVASPPSWTVVRRTRSSSLDLSTPAPLRKERRWTRWIGGKTFCALVATGTLAFLVCHGLWCSTLDPATARGRGLLVAQSCSFHLIAFTCTFLYLRAAAARSSVSGWRNILLVSLSLLWLLPVPYLSIAGIFLVPFVSRETERDGTLIEGTFSRQRTIDRLPEWWRLKKDLLRGRDRLPWWQRRKKVFRQAESVEADNKAVSRLLTLCDIKSFTLVLDVAVLSWLLTAWARSSDLAFWIQALQGMVLVGALLLGLTSLSISATRFVRRLLNASSRSSVPGRIYAARSLGIVALALFVGMLQGAFWDRLEWPDADRPIGLLVSTALSFQTLSLFGYFLSKNGVFKRPLSDHLLRLVLTLIFLFTEGLVAVAAVSDRAGLVVVFWTVTFLLCGISPTLMLLPWLLRPFKLRQILSPSTPLALRTSLLFFFFTAIAPFGGLAVPLWVVARRRLWPHFERELK